MWRKSHKHDEITLIQQLSVYSQVAFYYDPCIYTMRALCSFSHTTLLSVPQLEQGRNVKLTFNKLQ